MAGVLNDLLDEDALIVTDAAHAALPGYQSGQVIRHYNQVWTSSWQVMGSAIQWTLWGSEMSVALRLGRERSIFFARNEMDQSQFAEEVPLVRALILRTRKRSRTVASPSLPAAS